LTKSVNTVTRPLEVTLESVYPDVFRMIESSVVSSFRADTDVKIDGVRPVGRWVMRLAGRRRPSNTNATVGVAVAVAVPTQHPNSSFLRRIVWVDKERKNVGSELPL
jgi:hypothetical protein